MKFWLTGTFLLVLHIAFAQQSEPVTDSMPYVKDGLQIGYKIVSSSTKEVGDKGDFSRDEINCYVINKTADAKIIFYKSSGFWGSTESESEMDDVVRFECFNATGARLTSKNAIVEARPCFTEALVEEKDCTSGKTTKVRRRVQIGYFIPAGVTITKKVIVIVPLNQKPEIRISLLKDFSV
jgi:hypothetical protein